MMGLGRLLFDPAGPLTAELAAARHLPAGTARAVCGFCSTGCGLELRGPARATPDPGYPVNLGAACPKGWEALAPLAAADRATRPLLRDARGRRTPVSWDAALGAMVERFRAIQARHGPEAVAFLGTGQIVTEELAFLGALAKFGMGMVHGDGNTRQCMATSVAAYKEAFGFDAPPYTYDDLEASDVVVLVGSNLCIAHPILWQRLARNPNRPTVVVIDPRRTETAMAATAHCALRPRSDLALFYGLANRLIVRGAVDHEFVEQHTSGFAAFRDFVAGYGPAETAAATGLPAGEIEDLAALIAGGRRVSFWWTMGVNQSHEGTRVAQAIIDLALLTGNIGRPGTGPNSITGQCNAMGSRLFANTTNLLGGHDFSRPEHRQKVAAATGIPVERIPDRGSLAYDQILEAILAGKIRGLWIVATNPAHSWINQHDCHDVLGRLDFLVVQDMYVSTETAERAHLLLPAAGWGEKEGTFINSERRVGVVRPVARPPGEAKPDFEIFRAVARAWGCGDLFSAWSSPEAVFEILKRVSRGQPCDLSGLPGYDGLEAAGGLQWPVPEGAPVAPGGRRLFEDGRFFHADGRARFCFEAPRPVPEPPCERYPLWLNTGRGSAAEWHTRTRTAKSPVLARLAPPAGHVELNPADARRLGVRTGDRVVVASRRGEVRLRAFVTPCIKAGQVFAPMHDPTINRLTLGAFDPYSRQPAYKACAVRVSRAEA